MVRFCTVADEAAGRPGKRARTRTLILEVADELFQQTDWDDLTMEGIAEEAGLVKTTLFNHFSTKGELLTEVCMRHCDDLQKVATKHYDEPSLRQAFKHGATTSTWFRFRDLLDAMKGRPRIAAMLWQTWLNRDAVGLGAVLDRLIEIVRLAVGRRHKDKPKRLTTDELASFMTMHLLYACATNTELRVPLELVAVYVA